MTTQASEILKYAGAKWRTGACPLEDYFLLEREVNPFPALSSACWRGYVGHWSIEDSRLYLEKLTGDDGEVHSIFPLAKVFPGHTANRAFAHWYNGDMLLEDKIDPALYKGCEGMTRPALVLKIRRGRLMAEEVVDRPDVDLLEPWTSLAS